MSQPKSANDWLDAIHREFARETDRAAGIVVGAMLDEALRQLISKRLLAPAHRDRDILDGSRAPLGTFAARIDAAYQLGLISRFLARDLHIIRAIRNAFAHDAEGCTFERQDIRSRIQALESASNYIRREPEIREKMGPSGARGDFLALATWILYNLHREAEEIGPPNERGPEFGYIDWSSLPEEVRRAIAAAMAT